MEIPERADARPAARGPGRGRRPASRTTSGRDFLARSWAAGDAGPRVVRAAGRGLGRAPAAAARWRLRACRPARPAPGETFRPSRDLAAKREAYYGTVPVRRPDDADGDGRPRGGRRRARSAVPPRPVVPGERRYRDGDRVRHAAFGEGTVVSSKLTRDDEEVTVAFPDQAASSGCSRASPTSRSWGSEPSRHPGRTRIRYALRHNRTEGSLICQACGAENRADRRFCRDCGAPLVAGCPVVWCRQRRRGPVLWQLRRWRSRAPQPAVHAARSRADGRPLRWPSGAW